MQSVLLVFHSYLNEMNNNNNNNNKNIQFLNNATISIRKINFIILLRFNQLLSHQDVRFFISIYLLIFHSYFLLNQKYKHTGVKQLTLYLIGNNKRLAQKVYSV